MIIKEGTQFCAECGGEMPYYLKKNAVTKSIYQKEYVLEITEAFCAGCGEAVGIPGLLDYNAAEIERQYQRAERFFSLSEKMRSAICYLLKRTEALTPLALQKMLYFAQGIHMALFGEELFWEDCQAWAHGPVFKTVYETFRDFQYQPIVDEQLSLFGDGMQELSEREKKALDLAAASFGLYNGKILERLTHRETPWKEARTGCLPSQRSNEVISKASMKRYFQEAARQYDFASVEGIRKYIDGRLQTEQDFGSI